MKKYNSSKKLVIATNAKTAKICKPRETSGFFHLFFATQNFPLQKIFGILLCQGN